MIDNTEDSTARELAILESMITGNPGQVIEAQEARGQQQFVHSDRMPTDLRGERADWEALGFAFGEPDPRDPTFMPATLPDGWAKQGSDHNMWSYIVDEQGRQRVSIFYKAAFYDRHAHGSLDSVHAYVHSCLYYDRPIVTDETWATAQAVVASAEIILADVTKRIELYSPGSRTASVRDLDDARAERLKAQAVINRFQPTVG